MVRYSPGRGGLGRVEHYPFNASYPSELPRGFLSREPRAWRVSVLVCAHLSGTGTASGIVSHSEQPRAWRPGASGALPILCPQTLGPFWGVSELRPLCLEPVSGSVTPLYQVPGMAPAMVSHGNDSGPGGRGS